MSFHFNAANAQKVSQIRCTIMKWSVLYKSNSQLATVPHSLFLSSIVYSVLCEKTEHWLFVYICIHFNKEKYDKYIHCCKTHSILSQKKGCFGPFVPLGRANSACYHLWWELHKLSNISYTTASNHSRGLFTVRF